MSIRLSTVVATVVFTAALWGAAVAHAVTRVPTHVACVGDSITAGVGASSSSTNYPAVLQTLLGNGAKVMNFGHSGATMLSVGDLPYQKQSEYTSATTFVSGAGASAVVDVIIMLGTNDSKPYNWTVGTSTRAEQFRTDCAAMVDHFAQLPTHPLVYLALPPRAFSNTYQISGTVIHDQILPIIKDVAAAKGIPIIDVDAPTTGHSELFPDGVHPNDAGYKLVAQTMYDGLLAPLSADAGAGGSGGTASGGAPGAGGGGGVTSAGGAGGATSAGAGGATSTGGTSTVAGDASVSGTGGSTVAGSGGTGGAAKGGSTGASGGSGAGGSSLAGTTAGGAPGSGGVASSGGARDGGSSGGTSVASGGRTGTGTGGASSGTAGSAGSGTPGCSCVVLGSSRHERKVWPALVIIGLGFCYRRRFPGGTTREVLSARSPGEEAEHV